MDWSRELGVNPTTIRQRIARGIQCEKAVSLLKTKPGPEIGLWETGKKIHDWSIISFSHINKWGDQYYLCECKCGKRRIVGRHNLVKNRSKSCNEGFCSSNFIDITGKKFNHWKVIGRHSVPAEKIGKPGAKQNHWCVECDCSQKTKAIKTTSELINGYSKSCGCVSKNELSKRMKKKPGEAAFNKILNGYRQSARKRQMGFFLTRDEFYRLCVGACFYCGAPPANISKTPGGIFVYNGVDRVDNDGDYETNNCVSCCSKCNFLKKNTPLFIAKKMIDFIKAHNTSYEHIEGKS